MATIAAQPYPYVFEPGGFGAALCRPRCVKRTTAATSACSWKTPPRTISPNSSRTLEMVCAKGASSAGPPSAGR